LFISALVELGYTKSSFSGIVKQDSDIKIGEFTQELKVQGRTKQKAEGSSEGSWKTGGLKKKKIGRLGLNT